MRRYVSCIIIILCSVAIVGCDDIIEEDITDDLITIISPSDMANIEGNSVQFRWNGIDGADEYRVQINNETTNSVIIDSLVTTTIFNYTINPGSYAWRVRGENFAYDTPFSFDARFTVSVSNDLTNQVVTLSEPTNSKDFNADTSPLSFSWESLSAATKYEFQISKIENGSSTVIYEATETSNSTTIGASVIPGEGEYTWSVQAENENNDTRTSFFSHSFRLDTENPPAPELVLPIDGEIVTVNEEVTFTWEYTDVGVVQTGIASSLQIATDDAFNNVIDTGSVNTEEYTYTFVNTGTFFWRVKGEDDAENTGVNSDVYQIIVN